MCLQTKGVAHHPCRSEHSAEINKAGEESEGTPVGFSAAALAASGMDAGALCFEQCPQSLAGAQGTTEKTSKDEAAHPSSIQQAHPLVRRTCSS